MIEHEVQDGNDSDRFKIKVPLKVYLVILALVVYLGISWTPVAYTTIYGIQGKYLLPVLPMALLAVRGRAITIKKDIFRPLCFAMASTNLFVALNAICVILQR